MKKTIFVILGIFIFLQFIPAKIQNPKTDKNLEIKAPQKIMSVLKRSCYDCHSNDVVSPWYASIAPISFYIKDHVDIGRKWVNFSIWETYDQKKKDKILKGIYRTVYAAMPLASYTLLHKDAKLSKKEIKMLREWTGKNPF